MGQPRHRRSGHLLEARFKGIVVEPERWGLELLQKDVPEQIRVNKDTIYNWEMNRTQPEVWFIPKIISLPGFAPCDPARCCGERLKAICSALGLSQEQFAKWVRLDEGTIAGWKRGKRKLFKRKWVVVNAFIQSLLVMFFVALVVREFYTFHWLAVPSSTRPP